MTFKLLCWAGFHRWESQPDSDVELWMASEPARIRECKCCGKTQVRLKRPFGRLPDRWIGIET